MGLFFDAQGQLTLLSVVQSGRNVNSSKILFMSSFPAGFNRIGLIATAKTWRDSFLDAQEGSYLRSQW